MLPDCVRGWSIGDSVAALRPGGAPLAGPEARWPPARIDLCEQLWGDGFLFPGGADETIRLVRPLGLASEANLMLIGVGGGGAAQTIAAQLGVRVSGFEAEPELAALAMERITRARLGRRVQVEMWYPAAPSFRPHAYHHGLALEPLRDTPAEPVLASIAGALKPGGQLAIVQTVADEPLDPTEPNVDLWCRRECRSTELSSERAVSRMLGRLGFEIRAVEDITERHMRLAVLGWRRMMRNLDGARLELGSMALMLREAEFWTARERLVRAGQVRLVHWHAAAPRREAA